MKLSIERILLELAYSRYGVIKIGTSTYLTKFSYLYP